MYAGMVIAAWGWMVACGGGPVSTGVVPAASAPPAAELLAAASSPVDAHLTFQTHYLAEGVGFNKCVELVDESLSER